MSPVDRQGGEARLCCPRCGTIVTCGCDRRCGDDGDIDGPGTCKGLPPMPDPPLVEIVLVRRKHV